MKKTKVSTLWMDRGQLAEYLGVSVSTVDRWKTENKIPFTKIEGTILFHKEVIDKWLLSKTIKINK